VHRPIALAASSHPCGWGRTTPLAGARRTALPHIDAGGFPQCPQPRSKSCKPTTCNAW
jgi:hypothetical protein